MWGCGGWWCETGIRSLADVLWNIQMYMYKVMAIGSSNCCFGVSHSILFRAGPTCLLKRFHGMPFAHFSHNASTEVALTMTLTR